MQNLALVAGGDFDLVKSDLNSEPLVWDFRFFAGQRGTDRSATLVFAIGRGNMINPQRDYIVENEATVAIVGASGTGSNRTYLTRTGTNYSTTNDTEMFVSSSGATTAAQQADGDAALAKVQAREQLTFGVKQTDNCVYGKDFFLGDLGSAVNPFTGTSSMVKINAVIVDLAVDGTEVISGEAATP